MTQAEKNHLSEALLTFAQATERLMAEFLRMEGGDLSGEGKMLYNGMVRGVKSAAFYYGRFCDATASVLFADDADCKRIDNMREDAEYMIRLYMRVINCNRNGYPNDNIEKALTDLVRKDENPTIEVSEEVINRFRMK